MTGVLPPVTSPELAALNKENPDVPYYLSYHAEHTIATATVAATPTTNPITSLSVSGTSGWSDIRTGMRVQITDSNGDMVANYRVRDISLDGSILDIDENAIGDVGLIPLSSRSHSVQSGDTITIFDLYDFFSVKPYVASDGTINQDFNVPVSTHNQFPENIYNVTINGDSGDYIKMVANGGTVALTIVITPTKWATNVGTTISYSWVYPGSWTGVSGAATNTLTATAPVGDFMVYCDITDTGAGASDIARWVRIHSPADPPLKVIVQGGDVTKRDSGRTMTVRLQQGTVSVIPLKGLCCVWSDGTWGGSDVPTARKKFVGYLATRNYGQVPGYYETRADIIGIGGVLDGVNAEAIQFTYNGTTSNWQNLHQDLVNVPFITWWVGRWRVANLWRRFNYTPFSTDPNVARRITFSSAKASVWAMFTDLAVRYEANIGTHTDGEVISQINPSMLADRSGVETRVTLNNTMYSDIQVEWRQQQQVGLTRWEGVTSNLLQDAPTGSEAPDERVPGQSPGMLSKTNKIFDSQDDADNRAGNAHALANNPYPQIILTLPNNWDIFEVADMTRVIVDVPSDKSPTGSAIALSCIPISVTKTWIPGRRASISLVCEGETSGDSGNYINIQPAATNTYGSGSNPAASPITIPPNTFGGQNSDSPIDSSGKGVLLATSDGHVVSSAWTDISPTAAQRAAIGTCNKLISDPWNYKRLLLIGQNGILICDDHTVALPTWRSANLTIVNGTTTNTTFDFTASNGGWTTIPVAVGTAGLWTTSIGWANQDFQAPAANYYRGELITYGTSLPNVTKIEVTYDVTMGTFTGHGASVCFAVADNIAFTSPLDSIIFSSQTDGTGKTSVWTGSPTTIANLSIQNTSSYLTSSSFSGLAIVTRVQVTQSTAGTEVLYGDIVGSINRQGYFCWLSKRTISGTDYLYFNYTTNGFLSTSATQIAVVDASVLPRIELSSYNNASGTGVIFVTCGASSAGFVYNSTNWGSSFSSTGIALTGAGGPITVPYAKSGGGANAGSSPQFAVIKGTSGGNLKIYDLAAATVNLTTNTHVPNTPFAITSFTLDGGYMAFAATDKTFYTSSDGAATWSAKTNVTSGGDVYGVNGSPQNKLFYIVFGDQGLAYTADGGTSWTDLYSTSYDAFRSATFGTEGTTIIMAFADLSLLFNSPVTQ